MTAALVRPPEAIRWELRAAWASGKRVALSVEGAARVEGHVRSVAASGAFVIVAGEHVPCDLILAVHYPSLLGDSDWTVGAWRAAPNRWEPQRERLWYEDAEVDAASHSPAFSTSTGRLQALGRVSGFGVQGASGACVAGMFGGVAAADG